MSDQSVTASDNPDLDVLRFAGAMGHDLIGVCGKLGERRVCCEVTDLASARRLCTDETLTVYRRGDKRKPNYWFAVYDRRTEKMAAIIIKHNKIERAWQPQGLV